jgi:4-amino-4-deoxy-L-arabinose transferase-like glycosyltransferase
MNESGLRPLLTQFNAGLTKWRLLFLVFALIYAVFVSLGLAGTPIQWDEAAHLSNGVFLLHGEYTEFSSFYPPLFDAVTVGFFRVLGVTVVSARLVSVVFSLLSLWVVFELVCRLYGSKIALVASVLLGLFPGYFWLSRVAMIETMLVFFFVLSLFFFFSWLRNRQDKMLVLGGLALGLGFLTKYQVLVAGVIMLVSLLLLARDHLKLRLSKFALLILTAVAVVIPWVLISYQIYASKMLDEWVYALQMGNPEKSLYSMRFPLPIFYFIEMTWPYSDVHPISLLLYIVSLLGLGLFAWRRNRADRLLLIWFVVVFVFFTLIPNKHWRYVLPLFPALAISAASLIFFLCEKAEGAWRGSISLNRKRAVKVVAVLFTVFLAAGVFFSVKDTYDDVAKYQIQIDVEGATNYASSSLSQNESIMVLCPFNFFNDDMVRFYLWADGTRRNRAYQYPELPVDTYTPSFNITEFVGLCEQDNVKYVFTYEYGGVVPYFNTTLTLQKIYMKLYDSGNFTHISDDATFGSNPRRIFILTFLG